MKKIILICGLVIVGLCSIIFFVTAYSAQSKHEIALDAFLTDWGTYEYANTPWRSTIDVVEKRLGKKLGNRYETMPGIESYTLDNYFTYESIPVRARFEFADGKLQEIHFSFMPSDGDVDALFSKLAASLNETYGEASAMTGGSSDDAPTADEIREIFGSSIESTGYVWETSAVGRPKTILQLTNISLRGSNGSIGLAIGEVRIP